MEDVYKEMIEEQIQELVSQLNFKDPNSINFDILTEKIKEICGGFIPSVMPKWTKIQTANEDLNLDGSNKITEKITELTITYLKSDGKNLIPVPLKYIV